MIMVTHRLDYGQTIRGQLWVFYWQINQVAIEPICIYFLKPCWKFSWVGRRKNLIYESILDEMPFVKGIHWWMVEFFTKDQSLIFLLPSAWTNSLNKQTRGRWTQKSLCSLNVIVMANDFHLYPSCPPPTCQNTMWRIFSTGKLV